MRPKWGVPDWGDSPQSGPQNFELLNRIRGKWIKFSEWVDIKTQLNATKIGEVGSSVARGGAIAPPIGLPIKMQNKKNTTFLALLRLSFALD